MKYTVVTKCFGFRGRMWNVGEEVDVSPDENPPRHFVPSDKALPETPKHIPHRTEPMEVEPGKSREVVGGMSAGFKNEKIGRILTTDKVPNGVIPKVKLKRGRPSKKAVLGL